MNPYKPTPIHPPDEPSDAPPDSLNVREAPWVAKLMSTWWFLPLLFAGTFSVPVLVIGLGDPNLNPLDYDSILFQTAVNFVVGIFSGLVGLLYFHFRTKHSR